jgi:uncharacterized protein (TIGR03790 family)
MMRRLAYFILLVLFCCPAGFAGITPYNIAVIVNADPWLNGRSVAVGQYYCQSMGIPESNLLEVNVTHEETISQSDFSGSTNSLTKQIRDGLTIQLGVDPDDPAHDPIQALVLCYGIPSRISGLTGGLTSETTSVDSYLTLLFNTDPDLGPDSVYRDN